MSEPEIVTVATNRQARRNFAIGDKFECGMVLQGSEVKSLRESKVRLDEAFAMIESGEMWLYNLYVAPYSHAQAHTGHDSTRKKKLLLHRREIDRIDHQVAVERLSIVPMKLYFKNGKAKVQVGLGKGKKLHDKRQDMAQRDADREAKRAIGRAAKGDW